MKNKEQLFCIASSVKSTSSNTKVYAKVSKLSSNPLAGVKKDLDTMYQWALANKIDYRGCLELGSGLLETKSKTQVLSTLAKLFDQAMQEEYQTTYLYYTGHGDAKGNWVVQNQKSIQTISISEVLYAWLQAFNGFNRPRNTYLQIILDQCFAGQWITEECWTDTEGGVRPWKEESFPPNIGKYQWIGIEINASCKAEQKSKDWGQQKGGAFTYINYGKGKAIYDADQTPQTKTIFLAVW